MAGQAEQAHDHKGNQGPRFAGTGSGVPAADQRRFRGPVIKPKNFKGTLKRLWQYFGRERKVLSIIFAFIVIDSAVTLLAPYMIGKAVDAMSLQRQ